MFKHLLRVSRISPSSKGPLTRLLAVRMCSAEAYKYETVAVTQPREFVLHVEMNRPEKLNAMNKTFWREIGECFNQVAEDSNCRAVILSGAGRIFTAGLDFADMASIMMGSVAETEIPRRAFPIRKMIREFQESFSSVEKCPKPVIAAVHSACIGGGVDLISAADIRLCTSDAWFQVKEVEIGLAADVGTLQRLPKIIGSDSLVRELCYTARKMMSDEAKECGLVSHVYADRSTMLAAALDMAARIAKLSPVAVTGTKVNLNYSRDHSVEEGLEYMATWNSTMLQSEDILKAVQATMSKTDATFSKL